MVMSVLCDYRVVSDVSRRVGTYAAAATITTDLVPSCFPFLLSPTTLPNVAQTGGHHKVAEQYSSVVRSVAVACTHSECD
jgi:hypothetical protein